jgi:hypothetical protein
MGEAIDAGAGLPEENLENVEDHSDQTDIEQKMYELIIKNRVMARGLIMHGARTRDGLYTAWSYNALASAGLFQELLKRQGTENSQRLLGLLEEADTSPENRAGSRQLL